MSVADIGWVAKEQGSLRQPFELSIDGSQRQRAPSPRMFSRALALALQTLD